MEKLKVAKAKIDATGAKSGAGPISWADLLVLAGKVATLKQWNEEKKQKLADPTALGLIPVVPWPTVLGRIDVAEAAPAGRIPQPDADVQEIKVCSCGIIVCRCALSHSMRSTLNLGTGVMAIMIL